MGAAAAVAVGEGLGAELPVGAEEPADVAFAEVHQLSRLPDRDLLGEDAIEYMEPCLLMLVQCHFLHGRTDGNDNPFWPHRDDRFGPTPGCDQLVWAPPVADVVTRRR